MEDDEKKKRRGYYGEAERSVRKPCLLPGMEEEWILNGATVAMTAGLAAACSACRDRAGSVILREGSRKGGPRASSSFCG